MLSESLKVYLIQWDELLGAQCGKHLKAEFKNGYWSGYQECFTQACGIDWSECPADAEFIEQIALARNSSQHAGKISSMSAEHPENIGSDGGDLPLTQVGWQTTPSRTCFECL
jgi:hypothetical protein